MKKAHISLVIPTFNCADNLKVLLASIAGQSLHPNEIIISDSSDNKLIEDLVSSTSIGIPIIYIKSHKKYPGEKRNEGALAANFEWIAFLDVGTIPRFSWLEESLLIATSHGYDAIFGLTKYRALNHFQELLRAATFGRFGHETTPGTLVKLEYFKKSGGFIEDIRAGDDQEWRMQLRDVSNKCFTPNHTTLDYSILPSSLIAMQKKYFIYAFHGTRVSAQKKSRDIYFCILLLLSMVIVTKWNHVIDGWDTNPLFIPHILKIYTLSMVATLFTYIVIRSFAGRAGQLSVLDWFSKIFLFCLISLSVYNWNASIIEFVEGSILYIPHITKIYLSLVLMASFFYRGVQLPLKLGVKKNFLFPKNWIIVGLIGLSLDLVKAPGILLGVFLAPFLKRPSQL